MPETINPNEYPNAPAVIDGIADQWGDAYYLGPINSEAVLSADGAPRVRAYVQVRAGEVFMTTGSDAPANAAQGIYLEEGDTVELWCGSVVRFRAADGSPVKPVVVIERQFNL